MKFPFKILYFLFVFCGPLCAEVDVEYLLKTNTGNFLEIRQSEVTYLAIPIEFKYKSYSNFC